MGSATYAEAEDKITMIERLGPSCAIGTDGRQWIVFRADGRKNPRSDRAWQGDEWRPVGYIHSDRRALLACLEVKGLKLSDAGQAAIDRQDERIYRWREAGKGRPEQQRPVEPKSADKPVLAPAAAAPAAAAAFDRFGGKPTPSAASPIRMR